MTAPDFGFSLLDVCAGARRGEITTAHGTVDYPRLHAGGHSSHGQGHDAASGK